MSRPAAFAALFALIVLYFSGVAGVGLIGPDEPRYASVGHEMARSGDWVTPRLWGEPWFEKPALLYWMIGGAFRLGWDENWAPRLPVAVFSLCFLAGYFFLVRREFGAEIAWWATAILSTSALWMAFSHAAVTDLPLAAAFTGALLLIVREADERKGSRAAAGALLGLSVLAKGLVPLILFLPVLWFTRKRWRSWFEPGFWIAFALIALPWYVLCTMQNGSTFLDVFFLQHQLGRFASDALQHVQPIWFYVPVLLGALLPWTFFLPLALFPISMGREIYADRRMKLLAAIVIFGFVFFSASRNKLPGYLLPLIPSIAILLAAGIRNTRLSRPKPLALVTAGSALLLPLFPLAASLLPQAFSGTGDIFPVDPVTAGNVSLAVPVAVIAGAATLALSRTRALVLLASLFVCAWFYLERATFPSLDRTASARSLWVEIPEPKSDTCVAGTLHRSWRYGLNYYAGKLLPDCSTSPAQNRIEPGSTPRSRPVISRAGGAVTLE